MDTLRRIWLEINLKNVEKNFKHIQSKVFPAAVMPVLKANAYGLGMDAIVEILERAGAKRFALAELREAFFLNKKTQKPLQILGDLLPYEIEGAIKMGLVCPGTSYPQLSRMASLSKALKKTTKIHLLIDSGMGRLGIPIDGAEEVIKKSMRLPHIDIEGIYTHFPHANTPSHPMSKRQVAQFKALLSRLPKIKWMHMANSDGINNIKTSYFNLVRPGLNLYGVFDLQGRKAYELKPALNLKSRLIAKRMLPKGHTIGYGLTYVLKKKTWVGTIPAGYADGLPFAASNRGHVLIQGKKCKIIGRVSMDYTTIDLSPVKTVALGTEVVLIGKSGKLEQTVEDWATLKNSHPYDIICGIGHRVKRVYLD